MLGLARLATAAGGRTRAGRLLLSGGGLLLVADTISILLGLYSHARPPSRRPPAAAVLHGLRSGRAAPDDGRALPSGAPGRRRRARAAGASWWSGWPPSSHQRCSPLEELLGVERDSWAIVVGGIVLSALVLARMVVAVEQVEEVNRSRAELQDQLAYDAAHDSLTQLPNRARGLDLTRTMRSPATAGADSSTARAVHRPRRLQARQRHPRPRSGRRGPAPGRGPAAALGARRRRRHPATAVTSSSCSSTGVGETDVALSVAAPADRRPSPSRSPGRAASARVGASIGVALATGGSTDADDADPRGRHGGVRAKSSGRGRAHVYDASMRRAADRRRALETALRDAIEPTTSWSCTTSRSSTPTPARWRATRRSSGGSVPAPDCSPPDEFLPIAEESDLIGDVDAWVLEPGRPSQLARWSGMFGSPRRRTISVNLSPGTSRGARSSTTYAALWQLSEPIPAQLSSSRPARRCSATTPLRRPPARIRELGVAVSVDDFGCRLQLARPASPTCRSTS